MNIEHRTSNIEHRRKTPRRATWIQVGLVGLLVHVSVEAALQTGEFPDARFVVNGNAEETGVDGGLAGWSVYVREGTARLTRTTADKVEGDAAARLEIGPKGAVFDVRTGRVELPSPSADTTYVLTAFVRSESDRGIEPGAYFCLGTGDDLVVGHFRQNAGWQEVHAKITVPAGGSIRRLELSGGCSGAAVVHIDDVRLRVAGPGDADPPPPPRDPRETAIPLQPETPLRVRKILPADCRVVRKITHAPVDGRTDTRYSSGPVSEWIGYYGEPTTNYRLFNGNNGLHITLAEGGFNALQIRGGWQGRMYAGGGVRLTEPGVDHPPLCEIRPRQETFSRMFVDPVRVRRVSFFYTDEEMGKRGKPFADASFLRVEPAGEQPGAAGSVGLSRGGRADPDHILRQAIAARFRAEDPVFTLVESDAATSSEGSPHPTPIHATDEAIHFITAPQDPSLGIGAVGVQFALSGSASNTVVTLRVHDVLDPRRDAMGVDVLVPGPGAYSVTLDVPDQVFLPPEDEWAAPPRMGPPVAPPPVLWLSLSADAPVTVGRVDVALHRLPREAALAEAGAWRKFLLAGLFSTMSEPRPWMNLNDTSPVREQLETKAPFQKYKPQLYELLENAEIARLLLPDDDVVRQYHAWLYQSLDKGDPQPPPVVEPVPGAPEWAVLVRQSWRELERIASWWLDNRLVANGELGGGPNDDTDLYQTWQCLPWIESEPLGARLRVASARLTDTLLEYHLEEGINKRTTDGLHAYEEGVNQLALNAWWFYGDPVHFERAMLSAKTVFNLMVETEDGRLHFGSNDIGIHEARHGYETIGTSPGVFNWAPVRFMLHTPYVVAWYNRNPAALGRFTQWGDTWAGYQAPGAFVDQVDIPTGEPTGVTTLPPSANISPVIEFLALYQVTGDPAWHAPFKMGIDGKGYMGASASYGRLPHALVRWPEPYQTYLREKLAGSGSGYAGFFLTKDRENLSQWLSDCVSWYGRFRHMHTAAEQKTDRVLTYRATTPVSCYLGDAPNRNRFLNFTAVSYEGLRGEDFAAVVWDAGPAALKVALYNFTEKPLAGRMRVWRLDHGRYRVRVGPDADDDGAMEDPVRVEEMELQRYAPIPLDLPPRQVTVLEAEQVERLDDILERADLALSPIDTRLAADGALEVKVHNIGARPARDVTVCLVRHDESVASRTIALIEDPYDLDPRIVSLGFPGAQPGDEVVVDPDDVIPEIAEHNNRLRIGGRVAGAFPDPDGLADVGTGR